jgi:hypothetical protein
LDFLPPGAGEGMQGEVNSVDVTADDLEEFFILCKEVLH